MATESLSITTQEPAPRPPSASEFFQNPKYETSSTEERLAALDKWAAYANDWVVANDPEFNPTKRAQQTARIREMRAAIKEGKTWQEATAETARDVGVSMAASGLGMAATATAAANVYLGETGDLEDLTNLVGEKTVKILDRLGENREVTDQEQVAQLEADGYTRKKKLAGGGYGAAATEIDYVDRREKLDNNIARLKAELDMGQYPEDPDAYVKWLNDSNETILREAAVYNGEPADTYTDQPERRFDGSLELQMLLSAYSKTRNDDVFAQIVQKLTASTTRAQSDQDTADIIAESEGVVGEIRDKGETLDGPLAGPLRALLQADGVSEATIDAMSDPTEQFSNVVSAVLTGGTAKVLGSAATSMGGKAAKVGANIVLDSAVEGATEAFQQYVEDSRGDVLEAAKKGALVGLAFQMTGAVAGGAKRAAGAVVDRISKNEATTIASQEVKPQEQAAQSVPVVDDQKSTPEASQESPASAAAAVQRETQPPTQPTNEEEGMQREGQGAQVAPEPTNNAAATATPSEPVVEQPQQQEQQPEFIDDSPDRNPDVEEVFDEAKVNAFSLLGIVPHSIPPVKSQNKQTKGLASNTPQLGQVWRVLTKKRGNAPEFVRKIFEAGEGRQSRYEKSVENAASKLKSAMQGAHKRTGLAKDQISDHVQRILTNDPSPSTGAFYAGLDRKEQKAIKEARRLIDSLSSEAVAQRAIDGRMAKTFEENLGSYLTRSYMAFDPDANWNFRTLTPQVKSDFLDLLQEADKTLTREQAEIQASEILNPETGFSFFTGASKSGRINVGSLKQRKDLDPRYRAALGEIKDPITNVAISGRNVSQLLNQARLQREVVAAGLELGVFSTKKSPEFSTEVFPDKWSIHVDEEGNTESVRRQKDPTVGAFRGPGGERVFASQDNARQMRKLFEPTNLAPVDPESLSPRMIRGIVATATGISKFAQVLLNTGIYATAWAGGAVMEVANGRVFLGTRFHQALRTLARMDSRRRRGNVRMETPESWGKWKDEPLKSWDGNLTDQELEVLAHDAGIINQNVIMNDLAATAKAASASPIANWISKAISEATDSTAGDIVRSASSAIRQTATNLGHWYSIGDNAGKMSGLVFEMQWLKKAYPDMTRGEAMQIASEIVKDTTPTYDRVPPVLRELSIWGVFVNQYVSFASEIFRNTYNSYRLGLQEASSNNPSIRNRGIARLSAITGTLAVATPAGMQTIINAMFDDAPDEEEAKVLMKWFTPDWYRYDNIAIPHFDKETGEVTFLESSYTVPQAAITAWLKGVKRDDDDQDYVWNALESFAGIFEGDNLFRKSLSEAYNNKDEWGRPIYYRDDNGHGDTPPEIFQKSLAHIFRQAYKPGFAKRIEEAQKAYRGEQSTWGQVFTMEEVVANSLFPLRTKTYNIHEQFSNQAKRLAYRYSDAERPLADEKKRQARAGKPDEQKLMEAQALTDKMTGPAKDDFREFIQASLDIGIPREKILEGLQNSAGQYGSIPTPLRDHVDDILPELRVRHRRR